MLEEHGGHGEGEGMQEAGAGECGVGAEVEHEMSGVCSMGVSVTGAMVVSHGLQCQGHLDVVCLRCRVHCKPVAGRLSRAW